MDEAIKQAVVVYGLWIVAHYFASLLYVRWCVPLSFIGFIVSPFVSTLPYCVALRWVIHTSGDTIQAMFVLLGTWLLSKILK